MPKRMQYTTQAIVCLADDLYNAARATNAKRRLAGDETGLVNGEMIHRSALYVLGSQHILPEEYRYSNSRLIIIGHGNPESTHIMGTAGLQWTPVQLAQAVNNWLDGCVIKTISLRMCYGGGRRGGATRGATEELNTFISRFGVDPRRSFAYEFARHCGLASQITARTDVLTVSWSYTGTDPGNESTVTRQENLVGGVHKGHAYKITLTPASGASPTNPLDPTVSLKNPTA